MSKIDRRNALALVASLPALAVPAAVVAAASQPDAELLELHAELRAALAALKEASRESKALSDQCHAARVPMSDACRFRPRDQQLFGERSGEHYIDGEPDPDGGYAPHQVKQLCEYLDEYQSIDHPLGAFQAERKARIEEILTGYDRWWDANATARDLGKQSDRTCDAELDELSALQSEIADLPARTLQGLGVKAAAAVAEWFIDADDPKNLLVPPGEVTAFDDFNAKVLWLLARDILMMQQPSARLT